MSRLLFALSGALLVVVVVAGVVLALDDDPAIRPAGDVGVNPASHIKAHNSPSLARNPTNPDNVVVAARVDRPEFDAAVHWSVDGGETWGTTALPLPDDLDRPYAPDVAFADDGTLYVTYANLVGRGNQPDTIWLATSDDGGRTLSEPTAIADELNFQAQLSTDGGESWSEPVRVSDPGRQRVGAAVPRIDPATGDLVVVYKDFKGDVRDFQNLQGPPWDEPFELVFTRSADGGESFREGVVVDDELLPTERFLPFLPVFPGLAVGSTGTLYATWSDGRLGDADVFLARSTDRGRSWSEPVRVNDNPREDGTSQSRPAVSVAPNGRVDVLFYDRRNDPDNVMAQAFVATSPTGRAPFGNRAVSETDFDATIGPSAGPQLPPDLGSKLAIDSRNDAALAAWADTRLGDEDTGRQDVVATRVALPDPGALDLRLLLAAGVALAAALAVAGWWLRRAQARAGGDGAGASVQTGRPAVDETGEP
ncbi:MAG: hypothetical protein BRC31_09085 [Actinobacteria bacterium QS_5_72_10]|nr:MAG: hypothetical protein BRC31_09085 [Actinobacteria bacterium QS_5_72_10]